MKCSNRRGFTLIELVVILVVLGILMAVAVPKYVDLTSSANRTADMAYVDALRSATTMMMASNALSTPPKTNTAQTYWPQTKQVVFSNMSPTNYSFRYYTNVYYNFTNGLWTTLPTNLP